jgi:hypothetical protein
MSRCRKTRKERFRSREEERVGNERFVNEGERLGAENLGKRENEEHLNFHEGIPQSIRQLLRFLAGERVTIILKSGETEHVRVEAVVGDLLIAQVEDDIIKFIDIECICAIIVECEEILNNILRRIINFE